MTAANDDRLIAQFRPVALLDGGIERIAIEVGDGKIVKFRMPDDAYRPAGIAGITVGVRPMTARAAKDMHGSTLNSIGPG